MTERPVEDIIREAAASQTQPTPSSVWDAVETRLQEAPRREARVRTLRPRRRRNFRLPAIAAGLLVLVVAAWSALSILSRQPRALDQASAVQQPAVFEGGLEVEDAPTPVFSKAHYEGVLVPDGTGELKACQPC